MCKFSVTKIQGIDTPGDDIKEERRQQTVLSSDTPPPRETTEEKTDMVSSKDISRSLARLEKLEDPEIASIKNQTRTLTYDGQRTILSMHNVIDEKQELDLEERAFIPHQGTITETEWAMARTVSTVKQPSSGFFGDAYGAIMFGQIDKGQTFTMTSADDFKYSPSDITPQNSRETQLIRKKTTQEYIQEINDKHLKNREPIKENDVHNDMDMDDNHGYNNGKNIRSKNKKRNNVKNDMDINSNNKRRNSNNICIVCHRALPGVNQECIYCAEF